MAYLLLQSLISIFSQLHFADILLAFLGLLIYSSVHQKLTNKGPTLWPILGMLPSFAIHLHELNEWNTRSLKRAGGTYYYKGIMMGNCHGVVTADPVKIEYMLKTKFKNFPKGEYYRERFGDLLGDGIFNADGDVWKEQRRIATSEMHTTRFLDYSFKVIQDLVQNKLIQLIEERIQSGPHCVDLQEWLLRFTFDNVCIVAFGINPGCLGISLPEIPFAKAFEEATQYSLFRFLVPPFFWKPMRYFNLGTEKKLKEAIRIVHEFAENTVKNRKVDSNPDLGHPRNDLLSRLVRIQQNDNRFSDKFLRDFCISFILAGRDTSSVGLAWFFWLLSKNPDVERKILKEISARKRVFQVEDLEKMVYLEAALTEAMRLYPPVPIDFKEVQEDDVYPDGMRTRKGDRVFYDMYAMGRMEGIWGEDCGEFKPERWIKGGKFVRENEFKYAVFNAGNRLCVGKKFAYLQMKMVAASVLMRYKVKVVEGQVIVPKITTTLYMKQGLMVSFEQRPALA